MIKYYKSITIKCNDGKVYKTIDEISRKLFFEGYDLFRGESDVETYASGDECGLIANLNDSAKVHYFMISY